MRNISAKNYQDLHQLVSSYNHATITKGFYSRKLADAIRAYYKTWFNKDAFPIVQIFLEGVGFWQKVFAPGVRTFNNTDLMQACRIHNANTLFLGTWAEANFNTIVSSDDPIDASKIIKALYDSCLFNHSTAEKYRSYVENTKDIKALEAIIVMMYNAKLLNNLFAESNVDQIAAHKDTTTLGAIIERLQQAECQFFNQDNFNRLIHYNAAHLKDLLIAMETLLITPADLTHDIKGRDLLSGSVGQEYFNLLITHEKPKEVAEAIEFLDRRGLLTNELAATHRGLLEGNPHPLNRANTLNIMNLAGLISTNTSNQKAIAPIKHPIDSIFSKLYQNELLTQENFNALTKHADILFCSYEMIDLWEKTPARKLTDIRLKSILMICESNHPVKYKQKQFIQYMLGVSDAPRLTVIDNTKSSFPDTKSKESVESIDLEDSQENALTPM